LPALGTPGGGPPGARPPAPPPPWTAVRKLLPESWGFMCPVHTPDGAPCGLLTHLTALCEVDCRGPQDPEATQAAIIKVLVSLGMLPAVPSLSMPPMPVYVPVMLDGRVVGALATASAHQTVRRLREIKAGVRAVEEGAAHGVALSPTELQVPPGLEVAYMEYSVGAAYPGLYLFTQSARMLRPVVQRATGLTESIGTLEQLTLDIACQDGGAGGSPGLQFSHEEISPASMLSEVASFTPFSDYNQSPRNMYQCQMGKQTMGTPCHAIQSRTDTKVYRLQTPQTPLCRTARYREFAMDEYPNGTNAIVAVLAYTGYDMEDAMILNKSSVERGAFHATMYKNVEMSFPDNDRASHFKPERRRQGGAASRQPGDPKPAPVHAFGQEYPRNVPSREGSAAVEAYGVAPERGHADADIIDSDGLPHVGAVVWPGDRYACSFDPSKQRFKSHAMKGEEVGVVDHVTVVGPAVPEKGGRGRGIRKANVCFRVNRNPVIGDKFASRAGQKGVLSQHWPDVDMPYCAATGIRPDLLINPNAFPSRMTIGMLIESMASKGAALTGDFVDASPFQPSTKGPDYDPIAEAGAKLEAHGFHRHGGETLVSGITGQEFKVDIYIGPVYYQRLRHMVSDKFQVRSTGPINPLTRQPIKGRKFGGGIRLGEMERDSLLAHGAAYILHDRLHTCSDYTTLDACAGCGSILSGAHIPSEIARATPGLEAAHPELRGRLTCTVCQAADGMRRVAVPYVFKFLATELAAMNIKLALEVKS